MTLDFKTRFDQFERFFLYGATPAAVGTIELLTKLGKKVAGFVDRDEGKQSDLFCGHKVIAPEAFFADADRATGVIIVSAYQMEIAQALTDNGIEPARVFPHLDDMFYPTYCSAYLENETLDGVYAGLANVEEKDYFSSWRRFKETGALSELKPLNSIKKQYAHEPWLASIKAGGTAVDVGAFDGVSAVEFAETGLFSKIIAIEPFHENYRLLMKRLAASEYDFFETQQIAIGAARETIWQETSDVSSRASLVPQNQASESAEKIEVFPLDDLSFNNLTMLKVDIEGYELAFLEGAIKTLKHHRPHLAISAYHHKGHAAQIYHYLKDNFDGIRVNVGHHPLAVYELEYYVSFDG